MNIAFIPVRGGSKSIPLKNIKEINGKPLIYWTAKACHDCQFIDKVYIATDCEKIKSVVLELGLSKVEVIGRSEETATDTASTESVLLEFANNYDFDNVVLVQATSPMLTSNDLDGGFELFNHNDTDSVLSVVRQKRFNWEVEKGLAKPLNYDIYSRPRRQEFDGYLVENGAFYITSKKLLLESSNRISKNIKAYEMPEETYFEIDEPYDWNIIEMLMAKRDNKCNKKITIKLVATDCDGVLTDGGMYYSENGDCMKKFNTIDGMGFELLRNNNIKTAIITGETNEFVKKRAKKLKVDDLIMGQKDKLSAILSLCKKYNVDISECAYIGDDIFDIPAINSCGIGGVPHSAYIVGNADIISNNIITTRKGGEGCFREFVDFILKNHI